MSAARGEPLAYFEANVDRETDDCIIWPYGCDGHGYGSVRYAGRNHTVHSLALERHVGPRPPGLEARHVVCGVPLCFNVRHLAYGTHAQNMADRERHGRTVRGERIARAVLTERDVHRILGLHALGLGASAIGRALGFRRNTVRDVVNGRNWKHVPREATRPTPDGMGRVALDVPRGSEGIIRDPTIQRE